MLRGFLSFMRRKIRRKQDDDRQTSGGNGAGQQKIHCGACSAHVVLPGGKYRYDVRDRLTVTETLFAGLVAAVNVVRYFLTTGASRMSYLSARAVKKTLREQIYQKLLKLGMSYREELKTSEIVQVAVEGVEQLETYFGAYLPQFFYAMAAPLTLFIVLLPVSVPAAVLLFVCVPLIPVAIALVQTWAKKPDTGISIRRSEIRSWKICRGSPR